MTESGKNLSKAKELLEQNELVAIPTETVYGLAANAFNLDAIAKVFKTKNRPSFDPLIVHTGSMDQITDLVETIPEKAHLLASKLWPGPLTLLLEKKEVIPDLATSGMKRVAVRIPNQPLTRELLESLDFPLVAPSANPFGYISPTTPKHVADQLQGKISYILDGGPCEVGIESTIVGFEENKTIIYRPGGIPIEDIQKIVGETQFAQQNDENPDSPGMLKSHYAPLTPLKTGHLGRLMAKYHKEKIGVISFDEPTIGISEDKQVVLAPDSDMSTAAKNLFAALRELDNKTDVELILISAVPNYGLGIAINDRIRRAASKD